MNDTPNNSIRPASTGATDWSFLARLIPLRTAVLLMAAVLLVLYFQFASDGFFITSNNAALLIRQTAVVVVVAAGVAVLIIMGEFDLSVGSVAFFASIIAGKLQMAGYDVATSVLGAMAVGAAIGLLQGLVITRLSVPAFVVTLGGLLLWRGVGLTWTNAQAVGPVSDAFTSLTEGRMPASIALIGTAFAILYGIVAAVMRNVRLKQAGRSAPEEVISILFMSCLAAAALLWIGYFGRGLPYAALWIAAVVFLFEFMLARSQYGRRVFLVGSGHEAAMYAGISVRNTVLIGFVMMGTVCGLAGSMILARVGTSTPDGGTNLELTAIAAAVIGGVSLRGGMGTIRGAMMGAFLLATIDNGMSLLGVSSYAQNVVKALILVLAVGLDSYFTRRQMLGK